LGWQDDYNKRFLSADEAARHIKSGDRVVFGHAIGEPAAIADALVRNKDAYRDVEIVHMICMGKGEYCKPEYAENFRHNALFVGANSRDAVYSGRGDFTPCYFSEIPKLFTDGYLPVDVACMQVSPPDGNGFVSLGTSVDYAKAAIASARTVIAEVNPNMPYTLGDSLISVKDIDFFVKVDYPLIELKPAPLTDVEKKIGAYCGSLIEDGATLQLGIGSLPDAVLNALHDKKDLGIHSEMVSDGVVALIESGVINNSKKTLHPGYAVVSFLMGTRRLYDFVHKNENVRLYPVDYVNDPYVIAKNEKMISINSCVQVDLMGQVASESVGLKQISAVGGQVDFVRGANLSKGGKSIIAIPSTAGGDKISKIVPFLDPGAAVTTNRCDVNYIVTEYGIAQLKGKTLRQRAKALIGIAHPSFRDSLKEEWEKRFHAKFE
jgi:4-hydroxybutyrate CoA-transferase